MALTKVTERIISDNLSISGIATASNFKTGTTNVHNVGVELAGINVLGGDTPIGTGSTIWKDGGALFSGIVTATSFVGDITGNTSGTAGGLTGSPNITVGTINASTGTFSGDVTISGDLGVAGTLTYEDVTRVDAVGLSTFREGFGVGPLAGIALTAYKDGSIRTSGVITATTYYGSGAQLTGIDSDKISEGNTEVETIDTGSDGHVKFSTEGGERLRIGPAGQIGIGGATYGSSGQVLTSGGWGGAVSWSTVSGTTINNNADNKVITGSGTANTLEGEANLTFDGEQLIVQHAGTTDPENQIVLQTSAIDAGGGSGIFFKTSTTNTANRYGSRIHTVRGGNGASDLVFSTEITGGSALQEALKISANKNVTVSDGDLVIGTSGHGIDFSATADAPGTSASSSSELFANYEKGTWTPALSSGTVSPTNAIYIRCGDLVWCQATLSTISQRSSDTELRVTPASLPFAVDGNHVAAGPVRHRYTSHAGGYSLVAIIDGNGVYFGSNNDAFGDKAYSQLHYDEIDATYSQIVFSLIYRTNSA